MQEVFLGDMIKRRRMELGLTQEELCEGICEPITISRLENGKQTPTRNRINAILERLDLPADRYYALLSKNELEIETLQKELNACLNRFVQSNEDKKKAVWKQGMDALRKLEAAADKEDMLIQQFLLRSRVILGKENGPYLPSEEREILMEAMKLTCPQFNPEEIKKCLYTSNEVKIINQLAITYSNEGNRLEAIGILRQLYKYLLKHYSNNPSLRKLVTTVALNYATFLDGIKQYQKAIEIAEAGRKMCLDYRYYHSLSGLLEVQAECYYFLGEEEKSKDMYYQAYYLCKAVEADRDAKIACDEVKKYFGMEFPT